MLINISYRASKRRPDILLKSIKVEGSVSRVPDYQNGLANHIHLVANSVDRCDSVLRFLEKVDLGDVKLPTSNGYLNDLEVIFKADHTVLIKNHSLEGMFSDSEMTFKLCEFKNFLQEWRKFLSLPKSLDSFVKFKL